MLGKDVHCMPMEGKSFTRKALPNINSWKYRFNPIKCPLGHCILQKRMLFRTISVVNNHFQIPFINSIKMNGYTLRGSNSTVFAVLFSKGQLLKKRICS